MADTYEKDLGQKSSLTTSDFIRVVGSDNVSYKQSLTSVNNALPVKAEVDTIKSSLLLNNKVTTDLETYVANLPSDSHVYVWSTGSDATAVGAPVAISTVYEIRKVNSSTAEIIADVMPRADGRRYIKKRYDNTWGDWIQMPTRAEVDAIVNRYSYIAGATTQNLTVSGGKAGFIVLTYGTTANLYFYNSTSTTAYVKTLISQISDVSVSVSGLAITFSHSSKALTLFKSDMN